MIVKDFFWWLVKDNTLVNFMYLKAGGLLFKREVVEADISDDLIIDKEHLLKDPSLNRKQSLFSVRGQTSGTTNKPLIVYRSLTSILLEEYVIKSYMHSHGVPLKPKLAIIRGDILPRSKTSKGVFFHKLPFSKRLLMSSYHLSETNISKYFEALEKFKPDVIMAYPSSISLIAKFAKDRGWKPNWHLSAVLTSSELFKREHQETVKEVFGVLLEHYGQAERVAVLQQCKEGNYHVRDDYSDVFFIEDSNGVKIVGSNRHNRAMPLKFYDTGDYVTGFTKGSICECGNPSAFVRSILGRDDDYVVLPNGTHVGRLDVAFKGVEGLVECQLEQTKVSEIVVRLVPKAGINVEILKSQVEKNLRAYLGDDIVIQFDVVTNIVRTAAGKFKSVIRSRGIDCA